MLLTPASPLSQSLSAPHSGAALNSAAAAWLQRGPIPCRSAAARSPASLACSSEWEELCQEVQHLIQLGAIEQVPAHRGKGFNSHYFLTEKKNGRWRPILTLRCLNNFVKKQKFRMVTLPTIILTLEQRDWFSTLDLQDAYFHVTIHPADRRFLRFAVVFHSPPIQGPALWPFHCPTCLLQSASSCNSTSQKERDPTFSLSGRLTHQVPHSLGGDVCNRSLVPHPYAQVRLLKMNHLGVIRDYDIHIFICS